MNTKILVLWHAILGYIYKWLVDLKIINIPTLKNNKREKELIVSLTSYGRRISKSIVYYTLVSILRQSIQPDRIILWIDKTKWNEDNIPNKLKMLISKGVEVEYCDDIRSYTKLIPALEKYPDSVIITVDDDKIYASCTIERLYNLHLANPTDICCMNPLKLQCENGYPCKYYEWREYDNDIKGRDMVFPCGVDVVLYPPYCLGKDVTNRELFKKLSPLADDVWFWFCGCMNVITKIGIKRKSPNYSFDVLYQYFHKGSALTHTNRYEHQNDKQIRAIFDYYGVFMENGIIRKNNK